MKWIVLMLPFPPSVNGLYDGKKRRFKSRAYKDWEAEADFQLMQQKANHVTGLPRFTEPVSLTLHLGRPDKRKRDPSNYIKAAEDKLVSAGILEDDELVHDVRARWHEDVVGCMVEISTLSDGKI